MALNFLQRLSGVATATARLVEAVDGLPARILDTRKTTPGLRALEKYAVRIGGGQNHRFNLADGILIKDNHLAALRARGEGIARRTAGAARRAPGCASRSRSASIEARQALAAGADVLLLDNMGRRRCVASVPWPRPRPTEASGGITLDTVRAVAETGVDFISVGAITHSAPALDISLEVEAG